MNRPSPDPAARLAELEEALAFYAEERHWLPGGDGVHMVFPSRVQLDKGAVARLALGRR